MNFVTKRRRTVSLHLESKSEGYLKTFRRKSKIVVSGVRTKNSHKFFFAFSLPYIKYVRENDLNEDYEKLFERELANRAAGGDETAFGEIVRRYSPRVFRVAGKFFEPYSLIEEAAQEIFLKAFVQIENYEGRGSLEGWLTRIAVTTCLNLLRTAKRQPSLTFADLTLDESAWLEEKIINSSVSDYQSEENRLIAADLIKRLLKTLPAEDALVLTMIDGEGESIKTVAEITGWSESKVKVRAFRARKRIREAVRKLLPPGECRKTTQN